MHVHTHVHVTRRSQSVRLSHTLSVCASVQRLWPPAAKRPKAAVRSTAAVREWSTTAAKRLTPIQAPVHAANLVRHAPLFLLCRTSLESLSNVGRVLSDVISVRFSHNAANAHIMFGAVHVQMFPLVPTATGAYKGAFSAISSTGSSGDESNAIDGNHGTFSWMTGQHRIMNEQSPCRFTCELVNFPMHCRKHSTQHAITATVPSSCATLAGVSWSTGAITARGTSSDGLYVRFQVNGIPLSLVADTSDPRLPTNQFITSPTSNGWHLNAAVVNERSHAFSWSPIFATQLQLVFTIAGSVHWPIIEINPVCKGPSVATAVARLRLTVIWNFDSSCSTGTGSCATKHVKKHCHHDTLKNGGALSGLSCSTWSAAKAGCIALGSMCFGVYDELCNKSGDIKLCDKSGIRTSSDLKSASNPSCVFEKPKHGFYVV